MAASDPSHLDLAELRQLLRAADPATLLVQPRLLRRVIKRDRKLTNLGLRVPHSRSFVLARDAVLALADREELDLGPEQELPATLLLLAAPEPEVLAATPRAAVLLEYWRLLFHARVHQAIAERVAEHRLPLAALRQRIHAIGQTEFDEIRTVLRQEKYLLPPRDERTTYEEFAAVYLELRFFAATTLARYFPALKDAVHVDPILAEDVDAEALFAATRLKGAPDPVFLACAAERMEPSGFDAATATTLPRAPSTEAYRTLLTRADQAAETGNVVRAALCRAQAADAAPPELADEVQTRARADLHRLVERLQHALDLGNVEAKKWHVVLAALLPRAAHGVWPAEARLLFDLQKVCVDHERPVYKPDLVEWAYSLFREPLVRPLPHQPLVLTVKHLRSAVERLPSLRIADAERRTLTKLVHEALHHAEERLRERFRPLLEGVLHEVGLRPENVAERVSHNKLIEELVDRIAERGFLTLPDVRDAVSRNDVKLADLAGPGELLAGDALIRANRLLAARAVGVYRRGEVYLRAMQRGSSLAFGTTVGRWLTLFVALPLGAAYGTVVFVQELLHAVRLPHHLNPIALGATVGILGVFFLLLMHVESFRTAVLHGMRAAGEAARFLVLEVPAALIRLPLVRRLLDSWSFLFFVRYALKPLPLSALVGVGLWASGVDVALSIVTASVLHVVVSLLVNSRFGRDLEEALIDWLVRKWEYFHDLIPGLFHLVMDFFKWLLEGIERYLYTVDEWLRFRSGQSQLTLAAKTVFGFVWFLASYAVRLFVVVFVEPWVNPIKHFPAVTVAAKLLLPLMPVMMGAFAAPLMFLSAPVAYIIALVLVKAIPGAAGFLAWELRENWRLYRTNRPRTLRAAVIGHHGETMLRLMKPGFHSGTLPKLYGKLRRAERRAQRGGSWRPVRKLREELYEIEELLHHFAERELLALLNGCKSWSAGPVELAGVEATSNRVRFRLACPLLTEPALELCFEEQSGLLLACISRAPQLAHFTETDRQLFAQALIGFYKKAGVDLVREQMEASFLAPCPPYDIADEGLVVWPGHGYETTVVYELDEGPTYAPRVVEGTLTATLPVLEAERLLVSKQTVTWEEWVDAWECEHAGKQPPAPLLPGVRVLPC